LPNRIALDFILEKIVPTIGEKTIINIFGSGTVNKTTNKNVHFHGFVDNLAWEIKNSDAVIAPIWKGVGILEKVLVSMACGKTVITTNFAKKGIPDLKNNENAIIAETEKQFLEKTINFLEGKYNASKIGRNAKALIKRKYSNKMAKRLLEIVECVTK
jgi:glycosyltransferase involved in cell wall biosynthesis